MSVQCPWPQPAFTQLPHHTTQTSSILETHFKEQLQKKFPIPLTSAILFLPSHRSSCKTEVTNLVKENATVESSSPPVDSCRLQSPTTGLGHKRRKRGAGHGVPQLLPQDSRETRGSGGTQTMMSGWIHVEAGRRIKLPSNKPQRLWRSRCFLPLWAFLELPFSELLTDAEHNTQTVFTPDDILWNFTIPTRMRKLRLHKAGSPGY